MSSKEEDSKGEPSKEKPKSKQAQKTSESFMSLMAFIKQIKDHMKVIHPHSFYKII